MENRRQSNVLIADTRPNTSFSWEEAYNELFGFGGNAGCNMAYLAVDKHCDNNKANNAAIRWIRKDGSIKEVSYGDLRHSTSRFANLLQKLGVNPGETVACLSGRIPELYIAALGTLRYKAVFCPLFSVFGPGPIFQRLKSGEAVVLVTTTAIYNQKLSEMLSELPALKYVLLTDAESHLNHKILSLHQMMAECLPEFPVPYTDPETPALLHFTSGTTGMPKGAVHVHKAAVVHYITGKYVLDLQPDDIFWCTADPGWVTGTSYGILAPLLHGVTNVVDEQEFDALRWYSLLEREGVNVWYTSPTAIRRLMRMDFLPVHRFNLRKLRVVLSVGEPLNPEAVIWSKKALGITVLDNWWQTETGGIMISNYRDMEVKPGSMGKPVPGIEVAIAEVSDTNFRILDEPGQKGQLVIRKGWPSMFRAYLNNEARYLNSFRGNWYLSGDLAMKDEDGYFWFIGRADDIIKTSGHMVGPFEVESALMEHPAVAESAVVGIPDPMIGEKVKAFVVLKNTMAGDKQMNLAILAHCRKKLGPAIAPKEIVFVESLPRTRSGKIMRRLLKARELGQPEGDISTLE